MAVANAQWGFMIIWEFYVRLDSKIQFEEAYGPEGEWAQFFRQGEGYVGTELCSDVRNPNRYVTLDFWQSRSAYERFRDQHLEQYQVIDQKCQAMTEKEVALGTYERIRGPDS